MSDEKIQMPGDPDGYFEKIDEQRKNEDTLPGEKKKAPAARTKKDEKADKDEAERKDAAKMDGERGPLSPAQYDDDGWGDTPVQMRGE